MKVLLFTLEYPPFKGGIAKYYENIIKYWPEKKHIFVLNNNENKLISSRILPKWIPAILQLYKIVKNKKIKHVIVGHILPLGTVACLLQGILKFKYSVVLHGQDISFAQKTIIKRVLSYLILDYSQKIICNSSYTAKLVNGYYKKKFSNKIIIVNPGITPRATVNFELDKTIRDKNKLENYFIIFTIGRLVKRKGMDKTIQAVEMVKKYIPNIKYFIAGAGPDEKYLKSFINTENKDFIKFIGEISEAEKWTWLRNCDIFVMPSRAINGDAEGFGIVYLEANISGKPVIAGQSGGISDVVEDYFNGLVADPNSHEDIAEAIMELYRKPLLRIELGEQGLRRAAEKFDWQRQIAKIYKNLN